MESNKSREIRTGERVITNNAAERSKAELLYFKDIQCTLFDMMDYSGVAEKYGEDFLNELDPPQRKTGNQILAEAMNGLANIDSNENVNDYDDENDDDDDDDQEERFEQVRQLIRKMTGMFPALNIDYIIQVVPSLMKGDHNPNPKYDMDDKCTEILGKLQKLREEKIEWQELNERVFDHEFDKPFGQCLVEVTQGIIGCWLCGNITKSMSACSRCKLATYCSKEC